MEAYKAATGRDKETRLNDLLTEFVTPMALRLVDTYHARRCPDVKQDMVQEALIRVAVVLDRFTGGRGRIFSYVTEVIRNKMIDALDKEMRWNKRKAVNLEDAVEGSLPQRFIGGAFPHRRGRKRPLSKPSYDEPDDSSNGYRECRPFSKFG